MLLNFSYQRTPVNDVYPSQAGSPDDDTKEMYRSLIKPPASPVLFHIICPRHTYQLNHSPCPKWTCH